MTFDRFGTAHSVRFCICRSADGGHVMMPHARISLRAATSASAPVASESTFEIVPASALESSDSILRFCGACGVLYRPASPCCAVSLSLPQLAPCRSFACSPPCFSAATQEPQPLQLLTKHRPLWHAALMRSLLRCPLLLPHIHELTVGCLSCGRSQLIRHTTALRRGSCGTGAPPPPASVPHPLVMIILRPTCTLSTPAVGRGMGRRALRDRERKRTRRRPVKEATRMSGRGRSAQRMTKRRPARHSLKLFPPPL